MDSQRGEEEEWEVSFKVELSRTVGGGEITHHRRTLSWPEHWFSSHLLSASKGVVEAGNIGHDGLLIRLWGVHDVWGSIVGY